MRNLFEGIYSTEDPIRQNLLVSYYYEIGNKTRVAF